MTQQEFDEATARLRQAEAALEAARSQKAAAESRVAEASARAASAEVSQGYATVVAPFAGTVAERLMDPGSFAGPGQPIVRIEKAGGFRLEVAVPESRITSVQVGGTVPVEIDLAGAEAFDGRIVEVVPAVDAASRTFTVKIDLPARRGLRSGLYGRAYLPGEEREAVLVPERAVSSVGQLDSVFVVEGETARKRLIKLGELRDGSYEVLSGLGNGDLVVVSGAVSDGARVNVRRADP